MLFQQYLPTHRLTTVRSLHYHKIVENEFYVSETCQRPVQRY